MDNWSWRPHLSLIQREGGVGGREANNPQLGAVQYFKRDQWNKSEGKTEIFKLLRKFLLFYMRNNHRPQSTSADKAVCWIPPDWRSITELCSCCLRCHLWSEWEEIEKPKQKYRENQVLKHIFSLLMPSPAPVRVGWGVVLRSCDFLEEIKQS